jgi:hypothetical protein
MNNKKKVLNLKKETLVRLQEKQLQALVGAAAMSNGGNTITVVIDVTAGLAEAGDSCCKRSCNGK